MTQFGDWSRRRVLQAASLAGLTIGAVETGVAATEETTADAIKWDNTAVGATWSSPTVVDGTVYIGTGDTGLVALDAETGDRHWQRDMPAFGYSSPCVVDGVCYAKPWQGETVYALDAATGDQLWALNSLGTDLPGTSHCSPTVLGDTCYVGAGDTMYAVDIFTGDIRWEHTTPEGDVNIDPIYDGGVAVIQEACYVTNRRGIWSFDVETGEKRWGSGRIRFKNFEHRYGDITIPQFPSSPVVVDGTVYITGNIIGALDADSGEFLWTYSSDYLVDHWTTPTIVDDVLFVIGWRPDVDILPTSGKETELVREVAALDISGESPSPIWHEAIGGTPALSSPTAVGNQFFATSLSIDDPPSNLYNRQQNAFAERFTPDDQSVTPIATDRASGSSPTVVDGTCYVGYRNGVVAIDAGGSGSSNGARVTQGVLGHHHVWANRASIDIDQLDLRVDASTLARNETTNATVEATLADGRTVDVTDRATLASDNSTIIAVAGRGPLVGGMPGTTAVRARFANETAATRMSVSESTTGDSIPAIGAVGTAAAIGAGAYAYSQIDTDD
ncbi:MAG: PQQ-binding-like beta-propeller repeat protein [Natrialbaceae archaeon]|nr:PQQ-binding-like beta-propeller repeat protein [Natrialbaceae archaeon]